MITRRDLAKRLGAAAVALAASRSRFARGAERPRPRALILINLEGGLDAIQSTDPKLGHEVSPRVHRGYEDHDIVTIGERRVGPLLGHLAPDHLRRMAIVNGVRVSTVAHETGEQYHRAMQQVDSRPSRLGLLGTLAGLGSTPAPLPEIHMPSPATLGIWLPTPGALVNDPQLLSNGDTLLSKLWQVSQDKKRWNVVDSLLQDQVSHCTSATRCTASDHARQLLEALARIPSFGSAPTVDVKLTKVEQAIRKAVNPPFLQMIDQGKTVWPTIIRDTVFALQHGLTEGVYIVSPERFDTHWGNDINQRMFSVSCFAHISALLDELHRTKGPRGVPLSEEVAVVACSELGRHPFLNTAFGKDHFPEIPVLLYGPGIRPGVYGATNELTESQSISPATGRGVAAHDGLVPKLDDVGATIVEWFGHDPIDAGYAGNRLDFLLA
jgi:hypothetical protein